MGALEPLIFKSIGMLRNFPCVGLSKSSLIIASRLPLQESGLYIQTSNVHNYKATKPGSLKPEHYKGVCR